MGTVVFYNEKLEWGSREAQHRYVNNWFDFNKYYKYNMSYITGQKDFQRGPQPDIFTEVRWWIQDNLRGEVIVAYIDKSSAGSGVFVDLYFQHEDDMVAFKIRWL